MIQDFASKMLHLINMRNGDFSWVEMQQKAFEDVEIELCANPKYSYCTAIHFTKKAIATTDALENTIGGVLLQEGHPAINVMQKLTPAEQNCLIIEREAPAIVFVVTRLKQFLLVRLFTYRRTTNHSNISLHQTKRSR